jgi:hypothetical protein
MQSKKRKFTIKRPTLESIQVQYTKYFSKACKVIKGQSIQKCIRRINQLKKQCDNEHHKIARVEKTIEELKNLDHQSIGRYFMDNHSSSGDDQQLYPQNHVINTYFQHHKKILDLIKEYTLKTHEVRNAKDVHPKNTEIKQEIEQDSLKFSTNVSMCVITCLFHF